MNKEEKKLLGLSVVLIESIRQKVGMAEFIDLCDKAGVSHLGYSYYLNEMTKVLGEFSVENGSISYAQEN